MNIKHLIYAFLLCLISSSAIAEQEHNQEKAVLITGASSGLGYRMTEVLSQKGFIVYAGVYKKEDLARLEAMENVEAIQFDVTVQSEIDSAVEAIKAKGRGLYGLINNAGVGVFGPAIELPVEEVQYQFDVNVFGPYRVTQAFAPMIIESKGRIATTGSIAGILSGSMFGPYSMSKHAIEAYTDSLAAEMARFGVSVSVIEPGNYASQIGNTARERILSQNQWKEETQYKNERDATLAGLANVTKGPDPLAVAEAALDIMQSEKPKIRYMVVHQEAQADQTIRRLLKKALELNQDQTHTFSREKLIEIFDQEMTKIVSGEQK